jgi:hypothetical protein
MGSRSNARRLKRANREGKVIRSGPLRRLRCVNVRGYNLDGEIIGKFETRIKIDGNWLTPKRAKSMLKMMGAVIVVRENVWEAA